MPPATLALARILLAAPRLLAGKCALQLGPARLSVVVDAYGTYANAASVLPAMAAVRGSARRVVVSDPGREGLAAVAADLRRNAHSLVIERLRLVLLNWAACDASMAVPASISTGGGGGSIAAGSTFLPQSLRQIRDIQQIQSGGYDLVYAADPLSEVAAAMVGEAAVAAARALFYVAGQLVAGGAEAPPQRQQSGSTAVCPQVCGGGGEVLGGLLLMSVPGAWAAAHGVGFAALAGMCGWELLDTEQLAGLYGVDAAVATSLGCAALAFRQRRAAA